ncbi:MAG: type II secretion system protein [Candidatus Roizmanbacteria bacterium]
MKNEKFFSVRKKSAFTLIEILVVIGIIAILIGLGSVSYSTAQKKARDARRKGDIQAIQNAFEQYYSICGFSYPVTATGDVPATVDCADPAQTIMSAVPTDPLGSAYTVIAADSGGASYTICPPVVRTEGGVSYRMEAENCTSTGNECCLSQVQ